MEKAIFFQGNNIFDIDVVLGSIAWVSVESFHHRSPHTVQVLQEICLLSCHVPHGGQYCASYTLSL